MSVFNSEQSKQAIGKSLVIPTNKACIKGVDYSEIESLLSVINWLDTDNYQSEIKLVRLFIKKLHANLKKRNSVKTEVVNGLLKTKDDFTFLSFVYELREGLWN